MTAGTLLSRVTGFGRIVALAYALGLGSRARLADTYNLANTTPNIVYDLLLGGILSAFIVPVFVDHLTRPATARNAVDGAGNSAVDDGWTAISAIVTAAVTFLLVTSVLFVVAGALGVPHLHGRPSAVGDRRPDRRRHVPAALLRASGALLRHRRALHRVAQRPAPVLLAHGRARAQQPRRDRRPARRAPPQPQPRPRRRAPRHRPAPLARPRHDCRRRRTGARALAAVEGRRRAPPLRVGAPASGHPARAPAGGMDARLRRRQPGLVLGGARARQPRGRATSPPTPMRTSSSSCRTACSPSRSSPRSCPTWPSAGRPATATAIAIDSRSACAPSRS